MAVSNAAVTSQNILDRCAVVGTGPVVAVTGTRSKCLCISCAFRTALGVVILIICVKIIGRVSKVAVRKQEHLVLGIRSRVVKYSISLCAVVIRNFPNDCLFACIKCLIKKVFVEPLAQGALFPAQPNGSVIKHLTIDNIIRHNDHAFIVIVFCNTPNDRLDLIIAAAHFRILIVFILVVSVLSSSLIIQCCNYI